MAVVHGLSALDELEDLATVILADARIARKERSSRTAAVGDGVRQQQFIDMVCQISTTPAKTGLPVMKGPSLPSAAEDRVHHSSSSVDGRLREPLHHRHNTSGEESSGDYVVPREDHVDCVGDTSGVAEDVNESRIEPQESGLLDPLDGSVANHVRTKVLFKSTDFKEYTTASGCMFDPAIDDSGVAEGDGDEEAIVVPLFLLGGGISYEQWVKVVSVAPRRLPRDPVRKLNAAAVAALPPIPHNDVNIEEQDMSQLYNVVGIGRSLMFDAATAKEERRRAHVERLTSAGKDVVEGFHLKVFAESHKTGFEEAHEFDIAPGTVIAGRYRIIDLLGQATFSRAVRCEDMHDTVDHTDEGTPIYGEVCVKVINNSKEFFDQSLDEVRLLRLLNDKTDPDETHILRLIDFFYYKEHMFLVTELLSDNLYEFSKFNREQEDAFYFTMGRLQSVARQALKALSFAHSLGLMHCDLKPENMMFFSRRRCEIKVIDFGSSCFTSDHLSSYIQSRSYRAPEVILGADYDGRIDVWSLGGILVEMVTGDVLFSSETVPEMLARIVAVCGKPFPRRLLYEGRHSSQFINRVGCIYEPGQKTQEEGGDAEGDCVYLYTPVVTSDEPFGVLRAVLASHGVECASFIDFLEKCLEIDYKDRATSSQLLEHPFLSEDFSAEPDAWLARREAAEDTSV